jgi:prepilin-type N-terminal cleavage/methylation domain-containing protein
MSKAGRWKRARAGFTLMELMVVVVLAATLALLALPRLHVFMVPDVEQGVQRELENLILAVREESVLARAPLAILYHVDQGTYRSAILSPEGLPQTEGDPLNLHRRLPEGMRFVDIVTSRETKVNRGYCFTTVWPTGWIEPTTLHIQDDKGRSYTLLIEPIAGTVRLDEGYLVRRRMSQ